MFGLSLTAAAGRQPVAAVVRRRPFWLAGLVLLASLATASRARAAVVSLDDVDHWVGTGSNRAILDSLRMTRLPDPKNGSQTWAMTFNW